MQVRPIAFARLFIRRTNASGVPESYSASASAASFPETSSRPVKTGSSGTRLPTGSTPIADPGVWAASALIGIVSAGE